MLRIHSTNSFLGLGEGTVNLTTLLHYLFRPSILLVLLTLLSGIQYAETLDYSPNPAKSHSMRACKAVYIWQQNFLTAVFRINIEEPFSKRLSQGPARQNQNAREAVHRGGQAFPTIAS